MEARSEARREAYGGPRRRTVLFLMAETGTGHRSAANAIASAMGAVGRSLGERGCDIVIVDGIRECARFPLRYAVSLYGPATKYCPQVFGSFFHLTDTPARVEAARRLCQPLLAEGLRHLFERVRPDVIVSTHPFFGAVVPEVLRDCGLRVPFIAAITDLFTIHRVWLAPEVDTWIAPSERARQFLLAGGIDDARIACMGLPIDPRFDPRFNPGIAMAPSDSPFARAPGREREQTRAALGLDPQRSVALIVGGGEGVGGLARLAPALEREELGAQLVIVTGRNEALYRRLCERRAAFRMPVRVLGFVENMPELMRAADVLVSKAGSLTLSEALACALPVVLMGALPGQEEGNVAFVETCRIGIFAPTPRQVVFHLRRLLAPGNDTLARMSATARRLRRSGVAFDAAGLVFAHLPPASAPSVWDRRGMAHAPLTDSARENLAVETEGRSQNAPTPPQDPRARVLIRDEVVV
ncbi:MAG TPA: glycosyltransferase [Ktedonobacterales bacterium]